MSSATQITIIHGKRGSRRSRSFILGASSQQDLDTIRQILRQPVLDELDEKGPETGLELDGLLLTQRLGYDSTCLDMLSNVGLRLPLQALRDHWLSLEDRDNAFAIAEVV